MKQVAVLVQITVEGQSPTVQLVCIYDEDWTDEIIYKLKATEYLKKKEPERKAEYKSRGIRYFQSREELEKYQEKMRKYTSDEISSNWMIQC
ncbi:hypothetical protein [Reichenbachiella sp.]|uniref:hypothetical protein n=1 Tax=Reichenbachiella sp. TaxID=2184521 RepID=UPI003BB0BF7C